MSDIRDGKSPNVVAFLERPFVGVHDALPWLFEAFFRANVDLRNEQGRVEEELGEVPLSDAGWDANPNLDLLLGSMKELSDLIKEMSQSAGVYPRTLTERLEEEENLREWEGE